MPNQIVSGADVSPSQGEAAAHAPINARRYAVVAARLSAAGATSFALAATGGAASPLVPIAVAVAAACGLQAGIVAGAIAGTIIVAASVPALAGQTGAGLQALNHATTWTLLFPLAGTAAGLVHALRTAGDVSGERRRIAADLHDGVAQTLAHLRLELDMLSHPQLGTATDPERLARLARVADRTLTDVRALINDLSVVLPVGGLPAALRDHVRDLRSPAGPAIVLDAPAVVRARPGIEGQLFRITQEALSNALRHSGGSTIVVRLSSDEHAQARLTVEDDGRGLTPPTGNAAGLGLSTMQQRARAIGASIEIGERPGGGTRVEVIVPVRDLTRSA